MDKDYKSGHSAGAQELVGFLEELGDRLETQLDAFLIGGCNMALRGLKDARRPLCWIPGCSKTFPLTQSDIHESLPIVTFGHKGGRFSVCPSGID